VDRVLLRLLPIIIVIITMVRPLFLGCLERLPRWTTTSMTITTAEGESEELEEKEERKKNSEASRHSQEVLA